VYNQGVNNEAKTSTVIWFAIVRLDDNTNHYGKCRTEEAAQAKVAAMSRKLGAPLTVVAWTGCVGTSGGHAA